MTPRRVKRQSRHRASGRSQTSTHHHQQHHNQRGTQGRSSQRSRRHQYLNPVNRLMDKANESSTSTDSYTNNTIGNVNGHTRPPSGGRQGHSNPMYVHSRPNSTYSVNNTSPGHDPMERPPSVHSSYSNYHGQRASINPNPYTRPPVQTITPGLLNSGSHQRRSGLQTNGHTNGNINSYSGHTGTLGSIRSSTYSSGGTLKTAERERPPPYMFGVNSETVI